MLLIFVVTLLLLWQLYVLFFQGRVESGDRQVSG
jgi:hypothetical protein